MKTYFKTYSQHPYYSKVLHWLKLLSITGSAQLIVQAVGLLSGILIIRILPTHEYALYTIAYTMLGTLMMLTDSGISSGVMSQGSKVWEDRKQFGIVLATGLDLRKKFAAVALFIVTPFLIYLLIDHGASWPMSILLVLVLIPAFLTTLSGDLLSIAPKLHQDILPLQKNQVLSNVFRLVITTLSLLTFPFAFLIILASGIPQIWANIKLRKISVGYADYSQRPDPVVRKKILSIVKKTFPGLIYFVLYSQINIWLCSIMGSTDAVAQVGALSRLVLALQFFFIIFNTLIIPRFSKLNENAELLFKRFLQISIALLFLNLFIISVVLIFPSEVLLIIGNKYANLTNEIVLNVTAACLGFIASAYVGLYTCRGWVLNPIISILVSMLSIASGAAFINLSTVRGIFLFDIYLEIIQVLMYLIYIIYKINRVRQDSYLSA